jgi:hypothetical protein
LTAAPSGEAAQIKEENEIMGALTNVKGYPKTVELKSDVFGYAGSRIYPITKDDALSISKEFKLPTDFKKHYDEPEFQFYYLNRNHGEQHIIFWLPRPTAPKS